MNDVTLREQLNYMLGPTPKVFDTSAPIGPWIVPKDQIPNPLDLSLKLRISGHLDQDGSTKLMKFPIANLISVISKWHTLRPGDILATGDVGSKYPLNDQDVVEAEVGRSEEHTSELQSLVNLVCRLLLEKKNRYNHTLSKNLTLQHHINTSNVVVSPSPS